jgi:hypothetical protein
MFLVPLYIVMSTLSILVLNRLALYAFVDWVVIRGTLDRLSPLILNKQIYFILKLIFFLLFYVFFFNKMGLFI